MESREECLREASECGRLAGLGTAGVSLAFVSRNDKSKLGRDGRFWLTRRPDAGRL
jgi:hypothetical protein